MAMPVLQKSPRQSSEIMAPVQLNSVNFIQLAHTELSQSCPPVRARRLLLQFHGNRWRRVHVVYVARGWHNNLE